MLYRGRPAICVAAMLLATAPGTAAADEAEKTGIAAGLGLTAATGKTTMSDGAGAIEASLLDSDAMLSAGKLIREIAIAGRKDPSRRILILAKGDTVDFSMALWVMQRMDDLRQRSSALPRSACRKTPVVIEQTQSSGGPYKSFGAEGSETKKFGFARTDIVAALASDVTVGKIELSAEDRTLIHAIQMGGAADTSWHSFPAAAPVITPAADDVFRVLADQPAVDPSNNEAFLRLAALQAWTDSNRQCDSDAFKAMIETIDKFVASVTTAEKGVPAIVTSAQLASGGFNQLPLILRVAIDDRGGTAITRSNIWYTLGLSGAAVVTSGLKLSFQLSDPTLGTNIMAGQIRCVTRPTSYRDVRNMIVTQESTGEGSIGDRQQKLVTCAYRLG